MARVGDDAAERLKLRLREEEQAALLFAFRARVVALVLIVAWLSVSATPDRLPYSLAACGLLAAAGWAVYAARGKRFSLAVQAGAIVVDVAVIVVATTMPTPGSAASDIWLEQTFGRRSVFLYLMVYVVASSLSYSPSVVAATGVASVVGLIASFAWTAREKARTSGIDLLAQPDPPAAALELLGRLVGPGFVSPAAFMIHQIIFMGVAAGFIYAAVWRARAHLGRTLAAEAGRRRLARYFSPNIVDRLAAGDRGFETGREQVAAVLFVDIVGFTRLVEGLPPERTITLLRAFHGRMAETIFRHGGTLDKFIGDGAMATFGTPDKGPDDARRALACAFDMVEGTAKWNARRAGRGLPPLHIAVGLHVGPVLMGAIGSPDRLEFSTVGDTVNIAARLEALARDHDAAIVASAATLDAAEAEGGSDPALRARFRDIGEVQIAGRSGRVRAVAAPRPREEAAGGG